MTLKGKQNHYNVKLLRGYGVSISLKDNKISLRNGTYLFGHAEKEQCSGRLLLVAINNQRHVLLSRI